MRLQALHIRRKYDGDLTGEIELAGETGKIALAVNNALCERLVEVCASELVVVAKGVALDMTAEILNAPKARLTSGEAP